MTPFLLPFVATMLGGLLVAATASAGPGARPGAILRGALPWAPGIGLGLLSALYFLGLDLFGEPPSGLFLVGTFLLLAGLATLPRRDPLPEDSRPAIPSRWSRLAALILVLVLALGVHRFLAWVEWRPAGGFDAMAIWNYAARFLHRAGAGYRELIPELDPAHHMDYPLLLPGATAALWRLGGTEGYGAQHLIQLSFLLALPLLLRRLLRGFGSGPRADLAAAFLASLPLLLSWTGRQYADAALAYFVLAAAGGLAARLAERSNERPPLLLTGFMLAGALWTKNEGLPLVLLMLTAFVAVRLGRGEGRRALREGLRLLTGGLLPLLALVAFKTGWAPQNDLVAGIEGRFMDSVGDPERWRLVGRAFRDEANPALGASFCSWGAFWPLLGLLIVLAPILGRRLLRAESLFLILVSTGSLAGWFLVYVLTPQDQSWHLGTSLSRLLLQLAPTLLLTALVLVSGPGKGSERAPGPDPGPPAADSAAVSDSAS